MFFVQTALLILGDYHKAFSWLSVLNFVSPLWNLLSSLVRDSLSLCCCAASQAPQSSGGEMCIMPLSSVRAQLGPASLLHSAVATCPLLGCCVSCLFVHPQ